MAFYELRQYQIKPDKMAAWFDLVEGEVIPFIVSKGMVMMASFQGETDEGV
ncbi:NIPSNAP family protein [Boseongicola sp. H5]|uniref:NIPSNAP family protein n=1 Tax=Boseongicola sp. H5 TaxID=2763261 RepID=UPI0013E3299A|nr:NIPSNAP family protein [Boseongicola sp. H5]